MSDHSSKSKSQAEIVDGKLILSCPNAIKPIVWQMDLSSVKASALEVDEDKDGENFALFLKSANGERTTIVSFGSKKSALDALMKTSKALRNAQGRISASAVKEYAAYKGSFTGRALKVMGFLILGGFIAILCMLSFSILLSNNLSSSISVPSAAALPNLAAEPENGVPLSADDFLRRR